MKEAARLGRHNLDLLNRAGDRRRSFSRAVLLLDVRRGLSRVEIAGNAERVAARSFLFEKFVDDLLEREPDALQFERRAAHVAIHAHCHAKSLLHPGFMVRLAERLPGRKATLLDTGCCGMAGAFGMLEAKYDLSLKVAAPLVEKVTHQPPDAVVVASGTSCRHQIDDLTPVHPKHMAELLADAIR